MAYLHSIDTFGDIAAEDDAVLDYFLTTDAVSEIEGGRKLLVLGRKGSGKTALVRHFTGRSTQEHGAPLSLRSYPWKTHAELVDSGASEGEAYVASWRLLIAVRMASMICSIGQSSRYTDSRTALVKFLTNNFGSIDPEAREILTQGRLTTSGLTFAPQIAGNALGSISFGGRRDNKVLGLELDSLTNAILKDVMTAIRELRIERMFLHFDELDQGLDKVDEIRASMLVGLILAAREISRSDQFGANISPVVYLRSDIWEQLSFSDKNKITRSSAVSLVWNETTLHRLVDTRVSAKLGDLLGWDEICDDKKMRGSQPKFMHVLARTFMRPRDVIQFLNEALAVAKTRSADPLIFENDDINNARESYSVYLRDELSDEITPHWSCWLDGLAACTKTETLTFKKEEFVRNYRKMKTSENSLNAEEALATLFRFSVVGYERRNPGGGSSWAFRYLDADAAWDASAPRYKVHQGLKEVARLREQRN